MMTGVYDTPREAWNRCFGEGALSDLNLEFAHELFLYAAMSNDSNLVHWCLQELPMSTKPAQHFPEPFQTYKNIKVVLKGVAEALKRD